MTVDEIRAELQAAIRSDKRAAAILRKIAAGRASFTDTMNYSLISGRLTGQQLSAVILELSEGREELAEALLHDRYEDINAQCAAVQTSLDEKNGLHLAPQKAPFPADRAAKFVHSLVDPTVKDETIERRARSASENITVTFHDDFIAENAEFRDRAGIECFVERITDGNCCPWCTDVAGRYRMQDQPEGLFSRHDNCGCTIIYDGQVLRGQIGENGRRGRRWAEQPPKVGYQKPTVLSRSEAERLQAEKLPKRLTGSENSGIITVRGSQDFMGAAHKETIRQESFKNGKKVIEEWSFKTYQFDGYPNIWTQTYSEDAKAMAEYISSKVNSGEYGDIDRIIIAKNKALRGISSYDYVTNSLFISEELIADEKFGRIVSETYFPARNLDDVITHELDGHKRHWDNVKEFYENNRSKYSNLADAKQDYERSLRSYIVTQQGSDYYYISKFVSENAFDSFTDKSSLNELLADCTVLYRNNNITEERLFDMVEELMKYDAESKS